MLTSKRRKKMAKNIIIMTMLMFVTSAILMYFGVISLSKDNVYRSKHQLLKEVAAQIDQKVFLKGIEASELIVSSPLIQSFCADIHRENQLKEVRTMLETARLISGASVVGIINPQGQVIAATTFPPGTNQNFIGNNYSFRPYFSQGMKGKKTIFYGIGATTKTRGVYFAAPIRSQKDSGTVVGVLAFKFEMAQIDAILQKQKEKTMLVTPEGVVFSTNESKGLYTSLFPLTSMQKKHLEESHSFGENQIEKGAFEIKDSAHHEVQINFEAYNVVQAKLQAAPWRVVGVYPQEDRYFITDRQKVFILEISTVLIIFYFLILFLYINISKKKEYAEEMEKFYVAVNQSAGVIVITDAEGNIEYANAKFTETTGYSLEEVIGKNPRLLKAEYFSEEYYRDMWETISSGKEWGGEFYNRRKNGETYWESAFIAPVKNEKGVIINYIAIKEDVTEQKKLDEKLHYYASTDTMTNVFNRRQGLEMLSEHLRLAEEENKNIVVCFIDINGLKSVNDVLGHHKGDELILYCVEFVREQLREGDVFCRLGGDEFLIVFPDTSKDEAAQVMSKVQGRIELENNTEKNPYLISISYGLIECDPQQTLSIDEIISVADEEMYKHKKEIKEALGKKGVLRLK